MKMRGGTVFVEYLFERDEKESLNKTWMNSTSGALLSNKYGTATGIQQERYLARNKVAPSFKGALFVVEDVWVPCSQCHAPVDPVVRIPVGKLWFHPQCLRCSICSKPSRTQIFQSVNEQPVCADCLGRGFGRTVPRLPRAVGGSFFPTIRSGQSSPTPALTSTPRKAIMDRPSAGPSPSSGSGAVVPSGSPGVSPQRKIALGGTPFIDERSVTKRQLGLMSRQQAVFLNDRNIVLHAPSSTATSEYS